MNMAVITAQFGEEFADFIEAILETYDFTLPGAAGGTLGKDLVDAVAQGIAERSADAKDPDGNDWTPNEPRYAQYKADRYSVHQPGELGGQMLSLLSLRGEADVSKDSIEMTYGTGTQPPAASRSGVPLRPSEQEATDREKAGYFTDSGRRFYEFDEEILDACAAVAQKSLDDWLEAAGL